MRWPYRKCILSITSLRGVMSVLIRHWRELIGFSSKTNGDTIFLDCELHSLSSLCSDQAPLLYMDNGHYAKKQFYFRLFWPCLLGFLEVVQQAWHYPLGTVNPFFKLDCLLCNTAWVLKRWSDCLIGSIRAQLEIAKEAIH
jgi:hypothetical protein